jgi:hypothetical protein
MRVASAFRIPRRSAAGDQWAIGRSLRTAEATRGCHPIHTGAATTAPNRLRQERGRAPWCASRMMAQPRHAQTQSALPAPGPGHTCLQARARAMRPRRADPHHELTINAVRFCFCSGSGQSPRARVRARTSAPSLLHGRRGRSSRRQLLTTAHHQCCAASLLLLRPKPPPRACVRALAPSSTALHGRAEITLQGASRLQHRLQARARLERYVRPNSQAHRIILQPSPTYLTPKQRRGLCTAPPPAQAP